MACPKCGSHNLWDDNLSWGCNDCPFMSVAGSGPMIVNKYDPNDTLNGIPFSVSRSSNPRTESDNTS